METGGGPLSFRPVPREPTPSRDWKSIEWRRSTVAGDRYTSIVPVNLNWAAQWIQWNASLLSDSSPFPAFSVYIPLASSLRSRKRDLRAERSEQRSRASIVPRINRGIRARRQKSLAYPNDWSESWTVAITDFPAPSGDALTFQVVTNVGLTRGSITSMRNVYLSMLCATMTGRGSRPTIFDHGCNVVLIALPINRR